MAKTTHLIDSYSFRLGYSQIPMRDAKAVKEEIMAALNITSRMGWYQRLWGKIEPKVSEVAAINDIFSKYGIKEVWGN